MTAILPNPYRTIPIALAVLFLTLVYYSTGLTQDAISPLNAAQKGLQTISGMVANKGLDASWADDLSSVDVSERNIKGFTEYVVKVTRSTGTPGELFIYLNMNGDTTGFSFGEGAATGEGEFGY